MSNHIRRYETMLFNYETTTRTDLRRGEIKPVNSTTYKEKGTCLHVRGPPLKDIHALTDWRVPNVPFDLFGKPKDILWTNPQDIQKPYGQVEDLERKAVQRTRPRLIITPFACLDDIDDEAREVLVGNMYTTTKVESMWVADTHAMSIKKMKAPFPNKPTSSNPLKLQKLLPEYVSPEWRMDSVSWDNRQRRAFCDPSKEFWLDTSPKYKCSACEVTADREVMKKMKRAH